MGIEEDIQKGREAAFRLLAYRARSARELQQRLRQKGFSPASVTRVIRDLQEKGYQSDAEFARQYAREKWSGSGWGPARVRQGLRQKGITTELVKQVLEEVYSGRDLVAEILPLARKRWRSTQGLPRETRRRRLTGFLQRRGYNWETIKQVLERVENKNAAGHHPPAQQ